MRQRGGGGGSKGTDPFIINLDDKWRYVVNITPQALYPRTHLIGGWVDPRASLNWYGVKKKYLSLTEVRSPDRPARS